MKARLPKEYRGGGGGDMNSMLRQAQKMQEEMGRIQAEVEAKEFSAKAGGGAVEVTCSGKKEITKITIQPDVVDPEDVEMLEDLIMGAANEALRAVDAEMEEKMGKVTGGLGIPGMM